MLNDSFVIKMHPLRTAMAAPGLRRPSPCFCRRAKMNDVDPHAWLTQTIERIAQGWPISQIDALMPWNPQSLNRFSYAYAKRG